MYQNGPPSADRSAVPVALASVPISIAARQGHRSAPACREDNLVGDNSAIHHELMVANTPFSRKRAGTGRQRRDS
jgi:hypothetical protein